MTGARKNNTHLNKDNLRTAGTGNASNPLDTQTEETANDNQLLDEKAETYLRESGNIEDLPDDKDQQDMDETFRKG